MARKTKRELILEIFEQEGFWELDEEAIATINSRLTAIHGRGGAASAAYIARTLSEAGKRIRYQEQLSMPAAADEYEEELTGLIDFSSLAAAERSLLVIDRYFRRFQAEGDQEGMARCREVATRARLRARLLANNPQLAAAERAVKEEIVFWFELWLRTPELFADWIELRKCSRDFRAKFLTGEG